MSTIDIKSTDIRKQFWKSLIRDFNIEGKTITAFGSPEENSFGYKQVAIDSGYLVNYDGFPSGYCCNRYGELVSTRQSSFIRLESQLDFLKGKNDSDRGLLEMNFSLAKEVEIAGVQIWKAIEDIDCVYFSKSIEGSTDYIFTSLYQAAQGIERLLKVILELIAYRDKESAEKAKIDELLYGHNHSAMYDFIADHMNINLNSNRIKYISF